MDKLELDGKKYTRTGKKWADSNGFVACDVIQEKLNRLYDSQKDYSLLSVEELIKTGDQYKASNTLGLALKCYHAAFEEATTQEIGKILPRLTSVYRQQGRPQEAINVLTEASQKFGISVISPALLTSAAAAYCDLKDYKLAKKCCDRAYASGGGVASGELSAVYGRIRKEAPHVMPEKK